MKGKFEFPVVIDTDIGDDVDDTWAIIYLLTTGLFDVRLIIVGNYDVDYKMQLMAKILQRLGREDIPIARGAATAIPKNYKYGQGGWLKDFKLGDYKGVAANEGYLDLLHEIVAREERVCFFSLGTCRTLADYLNKYRQDTEKIFVYAMAGAVHKSYEGVNEVVPEFNLASDLAAARAVFASGIDYTMLPLDVCADLRLEGAEYERLKKSRSVGANVILENYRCWLRDSVFENKNNFENGSSILFDVIVPWYALFPEHFEIVTANVGLDENGVTCVGRGNRMKYAKSLANKQELFRHLVDTIS